MRLMERGAKLMRMLRRWLLPLLVLALVACKPPGAEPLDAEVSIEPWPPQVRKSLIVVRVPPDLDVVELKVVGDMTHAGMIPVHGEGERQEDGTWVVRDFDINMRGDWILTITAKDREGKTYEKEVRFTVR